MRPYFKFHALYMRYNGAVQENEKRPLYGHFWLLRAMSVIRVLICVVLYAPSDQMIREVVKGGTANTSAFVPKASMVPSFTMAMLSDSRNTSSRSWETRM